MGDGEIGNESSRVKLKPEPRNPVGALDGNQDRVTSQTLTSSGSQGGKSAAEQPVRGNPDPRLWRPCTREKPVKQTVLRVRVEPCPLVKSKATQVGIYVGL